MPRRISRSRNGRRSISSLRPPRRPRRMPSGSGRMAPKRKVGSKKRRTSVSTLVGLRKSKRTKIIVPPDSVRETIFATKGAGRTCRGVTNIYTSAPGGSTVNSSSGQQACASYYSCTASQLRAVLDATSMAPTGASGANVDTSQIFWRRAMRTFHITNMTNAPISMTLMHFCVKRDTNTDFLSLWDAGAKDAQGNTTDNRQTYGSTPFNNPVIPRYFKFKRTYDYTIAPGSTIKHTWIVDMHRAINNEVIASDINPNMYLAGITQVMFMTIKGYPGIAATGGAALSTPAKVAVYAVEEYRYTYITDNTSNLLFAAGSNTGAVGGVSNIYDQNGAALNSEGAATI